MSLGPLNGSRVGVPAATLESSMPVGTVDLADQSSEKATGLSRGVIVDLSSTARLLTARRESAAGRTRGNKDIEESDLPRAVKVILKRVRELKAQLQGLRQKLTQVQSDQGASSEQRRAALAQVQSQIQSVTAALSTALGSLGKAMKQSSMSDEQVATMGSLLSA